MFTSRRFLLAFAVLMVVGLTASLTSAKTEKRTGKGSDKGITWVNDYNKGLKQAAKSKKPIMVDFYADWCGWCKKLDSDVYTDPKVIEASRKFVAVKVNSDKDKKAPAKYGVTGLPTIVFLQPDGKLITKVVGYRPAGEFLKSMNQALDAAKK